MAGASRFSPQESNWKSTVCRSFAPTMVCFGGDDMKTLFITTTRKIWMRRRWRNILSEALSFTLPVSVAGMKKSRFIER